jgi:hypothetical protein
MKGQRQGSWCLAAVPAVLFLVVVGCGGGGSRGVVPANPQSAELLDRAYGYLIKGDPDFVRLAPNYATLRPFTRDTSMVVQAESERQGKTPPPDGFTEYFHIRLNKPMALRLIVADTTGNGLITYEFPPIPAGDYTMGSKGWPQPQGALIRTWPWVYVYWVGDQRFRSRYQFRVDSKQHFTYMAPPATGG